jgi:hypothetical protein
MLFVLPEVVMAIAMPHRRSTVGLPMFYLKSVIFICVFYINYYYIIGRTLSNGRMNIFRFLIYNLVVFAIGLVMSCSINEWLSVMTRPEPSPEPHPMPHHGGPEGPHGMLMRYASYMVRDGAMIILTVALAVALRLSDKWRDLDRRHREVEAAQRATELDSLKSQLNPHFLFNTLNNIYALIAINPATAQNAVHELSQLLRYVLYENPAEIELKREIDFISHYISLMKLRLGERAVNVTLDYVKYEKYTIAPMIFIAMIENAFKHGNTANANEPITIKITTDNDIITCETINNFDPATRVDQAGGIGIANLRRRLQLIYGNEARLTSHIEGNVYASTLQLPLHKPQE